MGLPLSVSVRELPALRGLRVTSDLRVQLSLGPPVGSGGVCKQKMPGRGVARTAGDAVFLYGLTDSNDSDRHCAKLSACGGRFTLLRPPKWLHELQGRPRDNTAKPCPH